MTRREKVVEFVKTHKKEVAIAAGVTATVIGGAVIFAITKKEPKFKVTEDLMKQMDHDWKAEMDKKISALNWTVGEMTDLYEVDFDDGKPFTEAIVNKLTLADIGKLGEECRKFEGVTDETGVSMVISLAQNVETF